MRKRCASRSLLGLVQNVGSKRSCLGSEQWVRQQIVRKVLKRTPASTEACALAAEVRVQLDHTIRQRIRELPREQGGAAVRRAYATELFRYILKASSADEAAMAAGRLDAKIATRQEQGTLQSVLEVHPRLREDLMRLPPVESSLLKRESQTLWNIARVYVLCFLVIGKSGALGLALPEALLLKPRARAPGEASSLPRTAELARAELRLLAQSVPLLHPGVPTDFLLTFCASVLAAKMPAMADADTKGSRATHGVYWPAVARAHLARTSSDSVDDVHPMGNRAAPDVDWPAAAGARLAGSRSYSQRDDSGFDELAATLQGMKLS